MVQLRALTGIERGVPEPTAAAEFFSWLFGAPYEHDEDGMSVACANGVLRFQHAHVPVRMVWQASSALETCDPDGVPVAAGHCDGDNAVAVELDHVRLNCADLAAATRFYQQHGLRISWIGGRNAKPLEIAGDELPPEAEWVHLTGECGYVSLSQADWRDYGIHNTATGPPRFMHAGFAVPDLTPVVERLRTAGTPHLDVVTDIGRQVYVNDPAGEAARGNNVEIVEYRQGASASGRPSQFD